MQLKFLLALALLLIIGVAASHAQEPTPCNDEDCRAGQAVAKRHNLGTGVPSPNMACVFVLMKDAQIGLTMRINYGDGHEPRRYDYPPGSAARTGGRFGPMLCVPKALLQGAVWAKICTADTHGEGGSTTFSKVFLQYWLREPHISARHPACLLGTEECAKRAAEFKD